ncbi:hypothetical protein D3C76_1617730 [compost metagenome]
MRSYTNALFCSPDIVTVVVSLTLKLEPLTCVTAGEVTVPVAVFTEPMVVDPLFVVTSIVDVWSHLVVSLSSCWNISSFSASVNV